MHLKGGDAPVELAALALVPSRLAIPLKVGPEARQCRFHTL